MTFLRIPRKKMVSTVAKDFIKSRELTRRIIEDHVNVWQKPLQYCKVINLQLVKINGKKMEKKN